MSRAPGPADRGAQIFLIFIGAVIILVGLAYCGGRI